MFSISTCNVLVLCNCRDHCLVPYNLWEKSMWTLRGSVFGFCLCGQWYCSLTFQNSWWATTEKVLGPGDYTAGFRLLFKAQILFTIKYFKHKRDSVVIPQYVDKCTILPLKGGAQSPSKYRPHLSDLLLIDSGRSDSVWHLKLGHRDFVVNSSPTLSMICLCGRESMSPPERSIWQAQRSYWDPPAKSQQDLG